MSTQGSGSTPVPRLDARLAVGLLLVAAGILTLLQNFNLLSIRLDLFWALLFGAAGLGFLVWFLSNRADWWAVIPGSVFIALALIVGLPVFVPQLGAWLGALILAAIGVSFLAVYLRERSFWWAIIPGGMFITLAAVAGLSSLFGGSGTGGLFFFGLGLTFLLVSVVPTPQGRMAWAVYPGVALIAFGVFITALSTPLVNYLWPAGLILIGLFLLVRTFRWPRS